MATKKTAATSKKKTKKKFILSDKELEKTSGGGLRANLATKLKARVNPLAKLDIASERYGSDDGSPTPSRTGRGGMPGGFDGGNQL